MAEESDALFLWEEAIFWPRLGFAHSHAQGSFAGQPKRLSLCVPCQFKPCSK